ncbi:hypothetical protein A4H34_00475 [Peptidiphaga gingivicola]|uniref:Uncharacterized protein n=1 Tax=Peptidiphaga gingivicola TaxID=2741497 RepID=A0A179B220_9ACTO|nr:hypothetical protein [Peptidiphaga gingivicola]OAP85712.1 hypothetical protein A4H34_00475 [Peptidiphaga gingivicola]
MNDTRAIGPDDAEAALAAAAQNCSPPTGHPPRKPKASRNGRPHNVKIVASAISTGRPHLDRLSSNLARRPQA